VRRLAGFLAGIPFLAGCFLLPSGESSRVKDVPEELKRSGVVAPPVVDRHLYGDVAGLRTGQWARYREGGGLLTLAVVGAEEGGVWVEVVEEGETRLVSARLVAPGGIVKKAFYGEVSKGSRSAVVPQPLQQWTEPPPGLREVSREGGEERCAVGGRDLLAQRVRIRFEDLEGRLAEEVWLWHPEVPPVYAGSGLGGLVRKRAGSRQVDLVDFGNDARPLLEIPR